MKPPGDDLVADTSAVIKLQRGDPRALKVFRNARMVHLPFAAKGELVFGAMRSSRVESNLDKLRILFAACPTIHSDDAVENEYARIKHRLWLKGSPVPENDIWIAACAKSRSLPLAAADDHFKEMDGLVLVDLLAP